MLKCVVLSFITIISLVGSNMLGYGIWSIINIATCNDELDDAQVNVTVKRHRLNRTTDGISATLDLTKTLDSTFMIHGDICKFVDGGCKQYQIVDDDVVYLVKKYAEKNVRNALELANVDPPELPLDAGHYEVENFIFDSCEFFASSIYGKFQGTFHLINNNMQVACIRVVVEFTSLDNDEDYC